MGEQERTRRRPLWRVEVVTREAQARKSTQDAECAVGRCATDERFVCTKRASSQNFGAESELG